MNLIFKLALQSIWKARGAAYLQVVALGAAFVASGILSVLYSLYSGPEIPGVSCGSNARWLTTADSDDSRRDRFYSRELARLGDGARSFKIIRYTVIGGQIRASNSNEVKDINVAFVDKEFFSTLCINTDSTIGKEHLPDETGLPILYGANLLENNLYRGSVYLDKKLITQSGSVPEFKGFYAGAETVDAFLNTTESQLFGYNLDYTEMPFMRALVAPNDGYSWADVEQELSNSFARNIGMFPGDRSVQLQSSLGLTSQSSKLLGNFLIIFLLVVVSLVSLVLCTLIVYQVSRIPKLHSTLALMNCLGAKRKHIIAFVAIEPLIICAGSLLLAIFASPFAHKVVVSSLNDELLRDAAISLNQSIGSYSIVSLVIFAALFLHRMSISSRARFSEYGEKNRSSARVRFYLATAQVFFSTLTLTVAVISLGAYIKSYPWNMKFDPENLDIKFIVGDGGVKHPLLENRISMALKKTSPGDIKSIAFADNTLPIGLPLLTEMEATANGHAIQGRINRVSPNFFGVLKIPFVEGGVFQDNSSPLDSIEPNVAVINVQLSRLLYGESSALGQTFLLKTMFTKRGDDAVLVKVVGVVDEGSAGNASTTSRRALKPMVYVPFSRIDDRFTGFAVFYRQLNTTIDSKTSDAKALALSANLISSPKISSSISAIQMIKNETRKEFSLATMFFVVAFASLSLATLGIMSIVRISRLQTQKFRAICYAVGAPCSLLLKNYASQQKRPVILGLTIGSAAGLFCALLLNTIVPVQAGDAFMGFTIAIATLLAIFFGTIHFESKLISPEEMLSALTPSGESM